MQPLEVTAALGTVHKLQAAIEEATHVPLAEQVVFCCFSSLSTSASFAFLLRRSAKVRSLPIV